METVPMALERPESWNEDARPDDQDPGASSAVELEAGRGPTEHASIERTGMGGLCSATRNR
jgi:hypothetical protein